MTPADRFPKFRLATALVGVATATLTSAALAGAAQAAQDPASAALRPYVQGFGFQNGFQTPGLSPLSDADARTYAAAFDAVRKGQFGLADSIAQAAQDTSLQGRLQFNKLMHSAYHATYGELKTWLESYHDQPGADRISALARKRQAELGPATPVPAAAPSDAVSNLLDTAFVTPAGLDPRLQMSREAYYGGDVDTGYRLATASGERWIAGMASFRLGKFDEAFKWLSDLAQDDAQTEWVRSAAAWWAARSAATAGMTDQAAPFLKLAAATPYTFYGLIAAHQLGLDTPTTLAPTADPTMPQQPQLYTHAADSQVRVTPAMVELAQNDPRARRAAALAQTGMKADAAIEIRAAMTGLNDAEARKTWQALAASVGAPMTAVANSARPVRRFDPAKFDSPTLAPNGGYTLEKSLVYAIVKQESSFNPQAVSYAGAQGLMQLMPGTAHLMGWTPPTPRRRHHPATGTPLTSPGENLRLGQAYVSKILDSVHGDLIRAVASYNSGPGTILKTAARLGDDVDSLLLIESTPGAQTREYVQKVMSNYWIYRKLWGLPSPTLDAVASGASRVPAIMDANKGHGAAKVASAG